MPLSPKSLALVFAMGLLLAPAGGDAESLCTTVADEALGRVASWHDLHKWFTRYPDCDDGHLAAGVSEYVTASLAKEWRDLGRLERRMKRDARFEEFVLRHIDATADPDNLKAIIQNATKRCPDRSSDLCIALIKRALEELNEPQ